MLSPCRLMTCRLALVVLSLWFLTLALWSWSTGGPAGGTGAVESGPWKLPEVSGDPVKSLAAAMWPNASIEDWAAEINGPRHWKPIRNGLKIAWAETDRIITEAGHKVCALIRDNWACSGAHYSAVLRETSPWRQEADYDLLKLPEGSNLLVVGNSFLAEVIHTIICNHRWSSVFPHPESYNTVLAHNKERRLTLLLLSNEPNDGQDPDTFFQLMRKTGFQPHFLVLGSVNDAKIEHKVFAAMLSTAFPEAYFVPIPGRHLGTSCSAGDCCPVRGSKERPDGCKPLAKDAHQNQHQCIPGPILRYAEELVHVLHLKQRSAVESSCLGVGQWQLRGDCAF